MWNGFWSAEPKPSPYCQFHATIVSSGSMLASQNWQKLASQSAMMPAIGASLFGSMTETVDDYGTLLRPRSSVTTSVTVKLPPFA